jgi:hypothetical protein
VRAVPPAAGAGAGRGVARATGLDALPDDLPVPVDDGAAGHLPGLELPALALPATNGETVALHGPAPPAGSGSIAA